MVRCTQISFFKGNPGDGRTKLVTIEVQREQCEKDIDLSVKMLKGDFTRVCGGVSNTQHTPIGVLEEELNALRNKGEMK